MPQIALKAYAKINLGLSILGRRSDGYHELRTIYQNVSLADDVAVTLTPGAGTVRLEASGWEVPSGRKNLAVRAAAAMLRETKLRRGISIRLHKRIPPASGLGGGSSDAAAVLRAVAALSGKSLPLAKLLHLAAELGSDVPFFLVGGRAVGAGRGEEVYPLPAAPRRWVVIFFPGTAAGGKNVKGMSTAEAYRLLRRPRLTGPAARPTMELFCAAAIEAAAPAQAVLLPNDFEPLLFRRFPELAAARRRLLHHGAETVSLTGSGAALFGLFADRATAARAVETLRSPQASVWLATTIFRRQSQALPSGSPR